MNEQMNRKQRVEPDTEASEAPADETGEAAPDGSMPEPGQEAAREGMEGETASDVEAAGQPDPDEEEIDPTAALIAELTTERDMLRDKWTRALAEAENVRRRAERDRQDAAAYGGTRLARDLLGVHDNLERALAAADDSLREQAAAFIEGVELTQRELLNAFAKHKIEKVAPERGEKFDPNRHQAMFEAPVSGADPGTVIEVVQAGFVIADRLLRPALVGVAKAAAEAPIARAGDEDTGD